MSLGDRMKKYEVISRTRLTRRTPAIIRIDGKAFHTLTKTMERPWDDRFMSCMWAAATALCEQIDGVKLAYVQSDEISLLLTDFETLKTQAWFDYQVQKMVSVSAAIVTAAFLRASLDFERFLPEDADLPVFDARVFSLPRDEVVNYFIWRQEDASTNSVSMLAQAYFTHDQLHGVSMSALQDMLMLEKGINWNDVPVPKKRGICVTRNPFERRGATRFRWEVDEDIPIFTKDRSYIERFVVGEWGEQIEALLSNPPLKPCEVLIDSYNSRIVLVTLDYDDDLSTACEGDEGVLAIIPVPASRTVREQEP